MHSKEESGELSWRYPVYAVLSEEPNDEKNLVVVDLQGKDCVPLFQNRELGELYLEQAQNAGSMTPLTLHACHNDAELEHLLVQLPASVEHVIWNATLQPQAIKVTSVDDLLGVIRSNPKSQ
jgi:hypothetical protein